jgi:peptidoglycan hydrolase CwlO-like protein
LKKKTYLFDDDTLEVLKVLRQELGKKETQIIREALNLYFNNHKNQTELMSSVNELLEKIEAIVSKVSELSYQLGRCEERNRMLMEELERLKRGEG